MCPNRAVERGTPMPATRTPRPRIPVSRLQARTVWCPACEADPGEKCRGPRGPREACHLERIHAYAITHMGIPAPSPDQVLAAQSDRGGWTKAQLAEWGVPWPPPKGWRRALEDRWRANG